METNMSFEEACIIKARLVVTTLVSKRKDYGTSNLAAFGEFGILVRANDKMERLKHLLKNGTTPENESLHDSWKDLAGYAILALMMEDGTFDLPLDR